MKKIVSFILVLVMLSAFVVPSYAATLSFSVFPSFEGKSLQVQGTSDANRMLTFYVTDANVSASGMTFSNNIYAMHQETVGKDGKFDITMHFPETMREGQYKLIIGGVGFNVPEEQRSYTFNYKTVKGKAVILEAENASGNENWNKYNNTSASNKQYLAVFNEPSTLTPEQMKLSWTFNVDESIKYDIYALVVPNTGHTTFHKFSVNGDAETNAPEISDVVYWGSQVGSYDVRMHWAKVREGVQMRAGQNTITYKPTYSTSFDTRILSGIDVLYLAPSSWNWEPYKLTTPVNENEATIYFGSGELTNTVTKRGETVNAKFSLYVPAKVTYSLPIWVEMRYKGELVSRKQVIPSTLMNQWDANKSYEINAQIDVPVVAPDGEYEIYCGVGSHAGFANVTGEKLLGKVTIGALDNPNPDTLTISGVNAAQNGKTLGISYTLSEAAEARKAKAFVRFWIGDVLWGVAESQEAVDVSTVGTPLSASLVLPSGMPAGTYAAELGFYNVNGTKTIGNIEIVSDTKNTYKPLSYGIYESQKTGRHHFWYINQVGAAIWDGEPFIPVGGMYCPEILRGYSFTDSSANVAKWEEDMREIDVIWKNDIKDLYLNASVKGSPTWVWEYVLDYLDERGIRYGIQANGGDGYTEQDSFYIFSSASKIGTPVSANTSGSQTVSLTTALTTISGAKPNYAVYTVVNLSSGNAISAGRAEMTQNESTGEYVFTATVNLPSAGDYRVYFTPNVNRFAGVVNFWKYGDAMLEHARNFAKKVAIGDGVRNMIDIATNESGYYNENANVRPYDDAYNKIYKDWLTKKYGNIDKLKTAWGNGEIIDFAQASRIIPIYTSSEENYTIFGYDEKREESFTFNGRTTQMWLDFIEFRDYAAAEFYNDLADAYKTKLDVPVAIKSVYFHQENFKNSRQSGGIDGLGGESYAEGELVGQKQMVAYGLTQQFAKTGWSIVTETNTEENIVKKHIDAFGSSTGINYVNSDKVGYGTKARMHANFDQLFDSGAKGIYDFVLSARHNQIIQEAYSYVYFKDHFGSDLDHFAWLKEYKEKVEQNADTIANSKLKKNVIYFTPAPAYTNGGGPNRFNAAHIDDHKTMYYSYKQTIDNKEYAVLLTDDPTVEAEYIAANFERGPISNKQGVEFGKMLDTMEGDKVAIYLGMRYDLGTVPQLDQYFTNQFAYNSNGKKVQVLNPNATKTCKVLCETNDGKPWIIRDKNLWIVAAEDWMTLEYEANRTRLNYIDKLAELGLFMDNDNMVMQDFGFENEKGVVINSIEKGNQTLKVRIKNNTDTETDAIMYAASYDSNGNLLGVSKKTRTLFSGLNYIETDLTIDDKAASAKGFIWDANMKPLTSVLEIK